MIKDDIKNEIDRLSEKVEDKIDEGKVEVVGFYAKYKIAIISAVCAIAGTCILLAMCSSRGTLL